MGDGLWRDAIDLIFPGRCGACPERVDGAAVLCPSCAACAEPLGHPRCSVCAVPFAGAGGDHPCGTCLARPPAFAAIVAAFLYGGPIATAVRALKYAGRTDLAQGLGQATAATLPPERFDRVVAVPLHGRRLAERGYDQAGLVAAVVGRCLGVRVDHDALVRRRETAPQAGLGRVERLLNVRGAFAARPRRRAGLQDEHVVLVDDVVTTGATVRACASALRRAGARRVTVAAIARAMW